MPPRTGLSGLTSARPIAPAQAAAGGGREFAFTAADFERIKKMIHDHAGIVLSPTKQDMVYGRLARRLREKRIATFGEYLDQLPRDRFEWEAFVNALTTNLTSFFREAHHFQILADRLRKIGNDHPIQIWCSAASTGEEPYSIAITACEAFNTLNPPVKIVASDINTKVIGEARAGIYTSDRINGLTPSHLQKYFLRGVPGDPGGYRVRPELQRLISFCSLNLLEPNWSVRGPFDAIFCRNVMIYFDKNTQYGILKRFVPMLREDGALFAGHSESFLHAAELFKPMGRTVYQRARI